MASGTCVKLHLSRLSKSQEWGKPSVLLPDISSCTQVIYDRPTQAIKTRTFHYILRLLRNTDTLTRLETHIRLDQTATRPAWENSAVYLLDLTNSILDENLVNVNQNKMRRKMHSFQCEYLILANTGREENTTPTYIGSKNTGDHHFPSLYVLIFITFLINKV